MADYYYFKPTSGKWGYEGQGVSIPIVWAERQSNARYFRKRKMLYCRYYRRYNIPQNGTKWGNITITPSSTYRFKAVKRRI